MFNLALLFAKSALAASTSISSKFAPNQPKRNLSFPFLLFHQVGTGRRRVNPGQFCYKTAQHCILFMISMFLLHRHWPQARRSQPSLSKTVEQMQTITTCFKLVTKSISAAGVSILAKFVKKQKSTMFLYGNYLKRFISLFIF